MMNFVRIAAMEQKLASSDVSRVLTVFFRATWHQVRSLKSTFLNFLFTCKHQLLGPAVFPHANYGCGAMLAIVGAAHLAGMLVNVTAQMLGYNGLDRIPAMFLGL